MNSFLLGLLFAVVLFVVIGFTFYLGVKFGKQIKKTSTKQEEPDKEEMKRLKKLHEGFVSLMNYDVDTALQRKKV